MQQPERSGEQRARLWELLRWMHERDAQAYAERWVGYMQGFPHHFVAPLGTLDSRVRALIPPAAPHENPPIDRSTETSRKRHRA